LSGITLTSSCVFMLIDRVLQPLAPKNLIISIPQRKYGTQEPQGGRLYQQNRLWNFQQTRPYSQVGLTEQKSKTSRRVGVRTAPPDILGVPRSGFYRSGLRVIRRCDPRKGWNTYVATDGSLMAPYLGPISSVVGFSVIFYSASGTRSWMARWIRPPLRCW
jgi:hypothetical protein